MGKNKNKNKRGSMNDPTKDTTENVEESKNEDQPDNEENVQEPENKQEDEVKLVELDQPNTLAEGGNKEDGNDKEEAKPEPEQAEEPAAAQENTQQEEKKEEPAEPIADPKPEEASLPEEEKPVVAEAEAPVETVNEPIAEPKPEQTKSEKSVTEEAVVEKTVEQPLETKNEEPEKEEKPAEPVVEQKQETEAETINFAASGTEESSGFAVVKNEQEAKVEPIQIKQNHVKKARPAVGIKNVERNFAPEIASPYQQKRKTLGSMKISLHEIKDGEESPEEESPHDFSQLDSVWKQIQNNLLDSRGKFEVLKSEPQEKISQYYKEEKLQTMSKLMEQSLDIGNMYQSQYPNSDLDSNTLAAFNDIHRSELKEIELFILVLNDWIAEKIDDIKESIEANVEKVVAETKEEPEQINSSGGEKKFGKVDEENDVALQAELLGVSSRDHEDLKIQVAKKQDSLSKSQRSNPQKEEKEEEKPLEEQEPEGTDHTRWIILAAGLVALGAIAFKNFKK